MKMPRWLNYVNDKDMVWFAGSETTSESRDDEIVVYTSFFRAGLQLLMFKMIAEVLRK